MNEAIWGYKAPFLLKPLIFYEKLLRSCLPINRSSQFIPFSIYQKTDKTLTCKGFHAKPDNFTASYFKKDGTLCCIVLKLSYLCPVIGKIPVKAPKYCGAHSQPQGT
jgi:hypothetical protein